MMLSNKPVRAPSTIDYGAMVRHLRKQGACTTDQLLRAVAPDVAVAVFYKRLVRLQRRGLVRNTTPRANPAIWVAVGSADDPSGVAPEVPGPAPARASAPKRSKAKAPKPAPAGPSEQCVYPRYCPPLAPPRQYDLMRAEPWRAPSPVAMRPGAEDHLRHKSRGFSC